VFLQPLRFRANLHRHGRLFALADTQRNYELKSVEDIPGPHSNLTGFSLASHFLEISRARVCISPAPQSPSPKLESTHSLLLYEWGGNLLGIRFPTASRGTSRVNLR